MAGSLLEDNNDFYKFPTNKFRGPSGTLQQVFGVNNITTDPQLDANYKPTFNSPCIGAGTTSLSNKDFYGANKVRFNTDIGAVWYDSHAGTTNKKNLASGGNK